MKLDFMKAFTLGMAVMASVKAAAEDGKITVQEVIDVGYQTAKKVAEILNILDKPLFHVGAEPVQ